LDYEKAYNDLKGAIHSANEDNKVNSDPAQILDDWDEGYVLGTTALLMDLYIVINEHEAHNNSIKHYKSRGDTVKHSDLFFD